MLGGPLGDLIGRKRVIWISILGVAPFTLLLPHVYLFWTSVLSIVIGLILASAFSAILVYAQIWYRQGRHHFRPLLRLRLRHGRDGATLLGKLADAAGIETVYQVCAYLPLIGLLTAFLPNIRRG